MSTGPSGLLLRVHPVVVDVVAAMEQLGRSSQGLVSTAQLTAHGVTRSAMTRAVAAEQVVRVRRRVYSLAPLPPWPRHVVTESGVDPAFVLHARAVLLCHPGAAASLRTAAALRGWGLLVEPRHVDVVVEPGSALADKTVRAVQRRTAARARARALPRTDRLRMTSRVQTVLDCAVSLPLLEAVVVCDSALRAGHVTLDELVAGCRQARGVTGIEQARRVLELADPLCGSVLESVFRVRMVLAGMSGFVTQAVLATSPVLMRVDFCFPDAGLVVEVDGAKWHKEPARDQARDNALAVLGWRVLRLTWREVVHQPEQALADVHAAVAATPSLQLVTGASARAA